MGGIHSLIEEHNSGEKGLVSAFPACYLRKLTRVSFAIYVDCPISTLQALYVHRHGAGHRAADGGGGTAHSDGYFSGDQYTGDRAGVDVHGPAAAGDGE